MVVPNRYFHTRLDRMRPTKAIERGCAQPARRDRAVYPDRDQLLGQVRDANIEHRQIFEAFQNQDVELAATLSREHCASTLRRLLANIEPEGSGPVIGKLKTRQSRGPVR